MPSEIAPHIWPLVEGFVARALERGNVGTFLDLVARDVASASAQLWVACACGRTIGAAVTTLSTGARGKVCTIVAFGGDLQRCLPFLPAIEAFARAERCTALRICGRKGWLRKLEGFTQPYVVMEKGL